MSFYFGGCWHGHKKSQMFLDRTCMGCGEQDCRLLIGGLCRSCDAKIRRKGKRGVSFGKLTSIYSRRGWDKKHKDAKKSPKVKKDA